MCLFALFQATLNFSGIEFTNLLAHNNISQISLQSAAVNCSFCDNLTHLGVPFILLAMVPYLGFSQYLF